MIVSLSIKNFALIQDIAVQLHPGMTVITGETGAGKSILLGALGLLLGKRADLGSAGDPGNKVIIEATFSVAQYELEELFESLELDYDPLTIIRREILPSGKSRAFVNDSPVSVAQLQGLGPYLVDIHSQHQNMAITSEDYQLGVLDVLGSNGKFLTQYKEKLGEWKLLRQQREEAEQKRAQALRERDYNQFQFDELEALGLDGTDVEALESEQQLLANADSLREAMGRMKALIEQESYGLAETLRELLREAQQVGSKASAYSSWEDRISSVRIEIEDILQEVDAAVDVVNVDPQRLMQVEEQLGELHRLMQKHQLDDLQELIELRDELQQQLISTDELDQRIEALSAKEQQLHAELDELAERIGKNRRDAVPSLVSELGTILAEVGMPEAHFNFDLQAVDDFRAHGKDKLELMFTANKGGKADRLRKVASGGEMSRIMLAVKAVLNKHQPLPTILLDEIDTGVSGEMAHRIAGIMRGMSRVTQLLVVTHLPQIAAKGNHHMQVFKQAEDDRTVTRIQELGSEDRVVEIAQMIGGAQLSESALAHARELLN